MMQAQVRRKRQDRMTGTFVRRGCRRSIACYIAQFNSARNASLTVRRGSLSLRRRHFFFFFFGTFAPFFRALERPIAMACFRLLALPPLPLRCLPRLVLWIAFFTSLPAALPYLAMECPF